MYIQLINSHYCIISFYNTLVLLLNQNSSYETKEKIKGLADAIKKIPRTMLRNK